MLRVGIIGGSGLTGKELIRILNRHKKAELAYVTSRQYAGKKITSVFPELNGLIKGNFTGTEDKKVLSGIDAAFVCLPHTGAMNYVKKLHSAGIKVIDLSADYRIKDPKIYKKWYKTRHKHAGLLKKAVYGLPAVNSKEIAGADIVANPGCYATSILLGIIPAAAKLPVESIIADSKTGISGAGIKPTPLSHYMNINENIIPYNYGHRHRHLGEIEGLLKENYGKKFNIVFTPQITSLDRGILSVIYIKMKKWVDLKKVKKIYSDFIAKDPFMRMTESVNLHNVQNTNFCDIAVEGVKESRIIIVISAIDNLLKGASGQAVQNMNIMFGLDEKEGLK